MQLLNNYNWNCKLHLWFMCDDNSLNKYLYPTIQQQQQHNFNIHITKPQKQYKEFKYLLDGAYCNFHIMILLHSSIKSIVGIKILKNIYRRDLHLNPIFTSWGSYWSSVIWEAVLTFTILLLWNIQNYRHRRRV